MKRRCRWVRPGRHLDRAMAEGVGVRRRDRPDKLGAPEDVHSRTVRGATCVKGARVSESGEILTFCTSASGLDLPRTMLYIVSTPLAPNVDVRRRAPTPMRFK